MPRWELAEGTVLGFAELKEKADSASDALGALTNERHSPATAHRALRALEAIGTTNSFGKIVELIQDRHYPYRASAILVAVHALNDKRFLFADSKDVLRAAPDVFTNGVLVLPDGFTEVISPHK
jgi:hypothetical protein